ncbi:SDR family NAD(P)-dependent oxidoreductase [Vitiosangium sp. GDMCC 1.1324]|uniref:SDR family NAD(P)-dependent oxidoreductase n=1 Tax=Vitiosangium sp. (strain GDMCC 1.1324) TaxID=2138576 RepID=UPI000D3341C9|nr:SDR family NAD(P)-dependent oxidoreductase [Vitiosangium sp. GDMCC 1.1324]PTL79330.1 oxidoreductase [Vitiosangium sp. GDMCC 1.1324]
MQRLGNKVAIITGGGSGIGAATAKLFVQEGAKVLIVGRNEAKLRKTLQEINHENISYTVADVSQVEDTKRYIRHAVERYGGIDVLVSNAGTEGPFQHIAEHSVEDFDQVIATNVRGVWLSIKHAFPELQKRGGGSIILTSSVVGVAGFPASSSYTASKHAIIGLARALAHDGAPFRIRVNAVCPGIVDNDMMVSIHARLAPGAEDQIKSTLSARVPLKRYGASEEIARMNLFLASDESSYSTGGVYMADGGITAGIM